MDIGHLAYPFLDEYGRCDPSQARTPETGSAAKDVAAPGNFVSGLDVFLVLNREGTRLSSKERRVLRWPDSVSAHTETKDQAINRARQIIKNAGGGELRIKNERGQLIDSDTIKSGR
jgi:hypothetical protein